MEQDVKTPKTLQETLQDIKEKFPRGKDPICFMLIGPPASGKSFIASKILNQFPECVYHDLDGIIMKRAISEDKTYHDIIMDKRLRDRCQAQFNQNINTLLRNRSNLIWEQLNVSPGSRTTKALRVKGAKKNDNGRKEASPYFLVGIYIDIPFNTIKEQLEKRNSVSHDDKERKFISQKTLENVFNEYVHPKEEEPFDLLFRCDENLELTLMPSTPYEKIIKEKVTRNKPSDEEIERRRAEKRRIKGNLQSLK